METIIIEASRVIPANIKTVYDVIADYEGGHQAILPKPAFREMNVLEGGYGAGTRLRVHVRIWGQSYYYNQIVEEPEPGRVILERDLDTGQYTTFTLDSLSDNSTKVTITSVNPLSEGIKGFLERISQPTIISNLFKQELRNLENYVLENDILSAEISP